MVKLRIAADAVPEFVTAACVPGAPVEMIPRATVAAEPVGPDGPALPACASTVHVCGYRSGSDAELLIAARYVDPPNVTASFAAYPVPIVHAPRKFIPAAPVAPVAPVAPGAPAAPCAPVAPAGPCGPAAPVAPVGPTAPCAASTPHCCGLALGVFPRLLAIRDRKRVV